MAAMNAQVLRPGFTAAAPDASAWKSATHEHFKDTDVYLLADGKYVYVRFAAANADSASDAVRLYLWSDKAIYTFGADAKGVYRATLDGNPAAAPQWSVTEKNRSGGYVVTMRLPEALFSSGGQTRWLAQFARVFPQRHLAYTWPASQSGAGNVADSVAFDGRAAGRFSAAPAPTAEPTVAAAAQAGELWPSGGGGAISAPYVPSDSQGVAVAQSRDNIKVAGVEAKSQDGTVQNAQSLLWTSPNQHTSAGVQRVATTSTSNYDVAQGLSFSYDNLEDMRVSAGIATDRGTGVSDASQADYGYYDFSLYGKHGSLDMSWNTVGPQYDAAESDAPAPGTTGYTLSASHNFGNVSVNAQANRYRDDLGNLADANERAAISAALGPALTFDVDAALNAATQYAELPYAQGGAALQYSHGGKQARISYHEDHFTGGTAREMAISGGFTLPLLGMVELAHRQTDVAGAFAGVVPQQSNSASVMHRLLGGAVSVGYQSASGTGNMTFSFEDKLPIGLVRATYYNSNNPFSPPNFSVKLVHS